MNQETNTSGLGAWPLSRRLWAAALVVWLVAAVVYLPKIGNSFAFDDRIFIQTDPHLRSFSGALAEFGRDQARLYRPLRSVVLAVFVKLFGVERSLPYHFAGIFFHATLAALVFLIVWLLRRRATTALVAGLVFALHPVHADRVANITGSFDLVGLMLGYGALAAALWYDRRGSAGRMWLAAVLFALACLASEEALMVWPMLAGAFFVIEGERRRRIGLLAVWAATGLAYLGTRALVLGGVGRTVEYAAGGLFASICTMAVIFWRYVGLLLWPVGLSPAYGPHIYEGFAWPVILGLAGIVGLAVLLIALRRRQPAVTLAIGWLFLGLAPFSNLLPGDTLMAERYLYAALGGFALSVGWLTERLARRPKIVAAALAVLFVVYGAATVQRDRVWGDPLTLWTQAAQRESSSFLANLNAGYHTLRANHFAEAEQYALRAHTLRRDRAEPLMQLGEAAMRQDARSRGVDFLQRAVAADDTFCPAYSALAQGYVMVGDFSKAGQTAEQAIACDAGETQAHYVLAYLYVVAGQCEPARPHLETILNILPRPAEYPGAMQLRERCAGNR
ncbi:MAG: hypothetical protein P9L99_18020 [Candidatus Lernaella stagnicola]|nr:hypothetical protein [Candidatus Lernaella stagnicola]